MELLFYGSISSKRWVKLKINKAKFMCQVYFFLYFKDFLNKWSMNMTFLKMTQVSLLQNVHTYIMTVVKIGAKLELVALKLSLWFTIHACQKAKNISGKDSSLFSNKQ